MTRFGLLLFFGLFLVFHTAFLVGSLDGAVTGVTSVLFSC